MPDRPGADRTPELFPHFLFRTTGFPIELLDGLLLVKEAQHQADQAERILKEAIKRIDAECPALSVKLSSLDWDPGDPA